jgi:hypothetical protein
MPLITTGCPVTKTAEDAVQENCPAAPVITTPVNVDGALNKNERLVVGPTVLVMAAPPEVADNWKLDEPLVAMT